MMNSLLRKAWNSSFAWGAGVMALRVAGFLFVMGYALRLLPPADIGLWYVVLNIAGLASAVDFGFSSVIGRHASYYLGGVTAVPKIGLSAAGASGRPNGPALAGLILTARRLYRVLAGLMAAAMVLAWTGWAAYQGVIRHDPVPPSAWLVFLAFAAGSAAGMTGLFWPQMLFGLNRVRRFQQVTLLGLAANYALAGLGLRAGLGILALALGQIAFILIPRLLAQREVLRELKPVDFESADPPGWKRLWPMTWRTGALSLCSFLSVQNLPFVCSWFASLETTAAFGLTLQIAIMLHGLASLWVGVKLPALATLRATGKAVGVAALFRSRLLLGMATYAAGAAFILLAVPLLLSWLGARTGLLPLNLALGLLLLLGADLFVGFHSAVLQTGNETPHLAAFATAALLALALFWPLGSAWGAGGVLASVFLGQLAMNYWRTPWQCWSRLRPPPAKEPA